MRYFAKVNTAGPATGFISIGEVLTEKQERALGEDKLNELVDQGVLGTIHEDEETETNPEQLKDSEETGDPDPASDTAQQHSEESAGDGTTDDAAQEEIDDEEDFPVLDIQEDVVNDQTEKPAEGTKRGKRGKANEGAHSQNRED